jgi:hypothetical protein
MHKWLQMLLYAMRIRILPPAEVCELLGHQAYEGAGHSLSFWFIPRRVKTHGGRLRCQRCGQVFIPASNFPADGP